MVQNLRLAGNGNEKTYSYLVVFLLQQPGEKAQQHGSACVTLKQRLRTAEDIQGLARSIQATFRGTDAKSGALMIGSTPNVMVLSFQELT